MASSLNWPRYLLCDSLSEKSLYFFKWVFNSPRAAAGQHQPPPQLLGAFSITSSLRPPSREIVTKNPLQQLVIGKLLLLLECLKSTWNVFSLTNSSGQSSSTLAPSDFRRNESKKSGREVQKPLTCSLITFLLSWRRRSSPGAATALVILLPLRPNSFSA
jgi:hypothetical protein